ncbi:bsr4092 [Bradyrhizobium diazoefficiens USDA 110]|uniref:Bsr4092 protein n=1 Tax=Bradyrhizobium diazoefficiens (strain JCM 10833 / BCRC 13528 / IAM 13628 / NBRC 14792 / USDA 110) TaxID=224911 RepID=Q89MV0_BRADU|nr:hypothetical protein CO678_14270 [Bradyrhizobium diazoefficiens]QBP27155.1 hypothetical protein Bdiaspc4_21175 [Bradyrhizobium diazoefficiens]BAC49357.1 bsr4092 [Bradyrhizobium diazoefficiens USDA 110]
MFCPTGLGCCRARREGLGLGSQPHRHCEEPLRRSNPDYLCGRILDCFAALAMTGGRQHRDAASRDVVDDTGVTKSTRSTCVQARHQFFA